MSKGKVLIEKESDSSARTPDSIRKNPHGRTNVNVPQGPRTGNTGAHAAKRGEFKAAKAERAPLADVIERAFGARGLRDKEEINPGLEGVHSDTRVKYKKRK
jgi:hypothetical protein